MVYKTKPRNLFNLNLTDAQVEQLETLARYHKKFKSDILRDALRVSYEEMEAEIGKSKTQNS